MTVDSCASPGVQLGTGASSGVEEENEELTCIDSPETSFPCRLVTSWPFLFALLVDFGEVSWSTRGVSADSSHASNDELTSGGALMVARTTDLTSIESSRGHGRRGGGGGWDQAYKYDGFSTWAL